jgi:HSP20 family protein
MAMAETAAKLQVKTEKSEPAAPPRGWPVLSNLRQEIDRLFDDFPTVGWRSPFSRSRFDVEPFWRREWTVGAVPPVDIVEKDSAYVITAEIPGLEEKNLDVKYSDGMLTIKGEKEESKEEKEKDYHLSERRYGSFQRSFNVPSGVDADKIQASFKNGVLTLTLPKSPDAQRKEKKIPVTAK